MKKAKAGGYKWVCMEWNAFDNATRSVAMKQACEQEGLLYTIWLTRNFTAAEVRQAAVESQCAGISVEGEIPAENAPGVPNPQAVNWPELVLWLSDLSISKSVVTNNAPFVHHDGTPWPEKVKPLVDGKWKCLTEAYDLTGDPKLWIDRRDFFAKQCGWPSTQPVIGVYDGRTFDDFPTRFNYPNWSVWDAGSVL